MGMVKSNLLGDNQMKKLSMFLICMSFITSGCTHGYRVYVNGYSEIEERIKSQSSIYVSADDPNSQNPIFDKQIKAKVEELLKIRGFIPASDNEKANYRITFHIGMDSRQVSGFEPAYRPYVGVSTGYWSGYHFGYTTYVPYYDTYTDRWLAMKVFARDKDTNEEKVVWVGEAVISTSGDDIRRVIDYLLVGCFEYFGIDTTRQRSIVISEENPDILKIESIR